MIRRFVPKSVEELAEWYMHYISPLSLIAGVVADNLILLRRVDLWTSNLLLFFYLTLAAACITLINLIQAGRLRHPFALTMLPLIPVFAQFAFGGLFSAYVSLYSRSAAYVTSWIFVVLVGALLLGNERFVRFYMRFSFQISIYFTVLFSFLIFFLPVVFHQIGPSMFVFAGVASLIIITFFLQILYRLVPDIVARERTALARSIAVIFVVFNVLYFTNSIPPLPLSLKDAGVYHSLVRQSDGSYRLTYEPLPWYDVFFRYNTDVHLAPGETLYVWSAVFAPSGLSTTIFHEWQHYDDASGAWLTMSTISFPISGGRDGGFRGYTSKNDLAAGKWRIDVITQYGQIVGRVSFTVIPASQPIQLSETVQ